MISHLLFIALNLIFLFSDGFPINSERKPGITASELREWISYLASDEMRGRANGSPEMQKAAQWIAAKFKEFEVKPLLKNREYIQNYSFKSNQKIINENNVIGIIEGSDPVLKQEYIVLSAHFDHLGVRKTAGPDSIFNGADDNASGTCALIGIAKNIKESGIKPGRSIIFAVFSGEESGMKGSRFFVANTPISLKNANLNINFEMIGHSEYLGKNNYYMTGCAYSNLDSVVEEYNKKSLFKMIDTISIANNLFFASDNIAFSRISGSDTHFIGIPSGTFATTVHDKYIHSPKDEIVLFDIENMTRLVNHFSDLVLWLSVSQNRIRWTDPMWTRPK